MQDETISEPSHVDVKTDSLAGYFDVDGTNPKYQDKLKVIGQYLRGDTKEYDDIDMMRDLRNLMFKLGTPSMGTSLLDHAYAYSKIARQVADGQKELERLMR